MCVLSAGASLRLLFMSSITGVYIVGGGFSAVTIHYLLQLGCTPTEAQWFHVCAPCRYNTPVKFTAQLNANKNVTRFKTRTQQVGCVIGHYYYYYYFQKNQRIVYYYSALGLRTRAHACVCM